MKYPQRWLEIIQFGIDSVVEEATLGENKGKRYLTGTAEAVLDRLHAIGALKDPPKPREIWWCQKCLETFYVNPAAHKLSGCKGELLKFRQVMEVD